MFFFLAWYMNGYMILMFLAIFSRIKLHLISHKVVNFYNYIELAWNFLLVLVARAPTFYNFYMLQRRRKKLS